MSTVVGYQKVISWRGQGLFSLFLIVKAIRIRFLKLNLPESITVEQVSEEIRAFQEELNHYLYEYENLIKNLEMFVKVLNDKDFDKKFSIEILLE